VSYVTFVACFDALAAAQTRDLHLSFVYRGKRGGRSTFTGAETANVELLSRTRESRVKRHALQTPLTPYCNALPCGLARDVFGERSASDDDGAALDRVAEALPGSGTAVADVDDVVEALALEDRRGQAAALAAAADGGDGSIAG
jgi:hypothetical protein